jgi:lysozyme
VDSTEKDSVKALLRQQDGLRLRAFLDTAVPARWTIGYGRNLTDRGINDTEAEIFLERDTTEAIDELAQRWRWFDDLTTVRKVVLVSMVFQMGLYRLAGFTRMLEAMQLGEFGRAADEMLASKWAAERPRRAKRLASLMRTGQWQGQKAPTT